MEPAGSREPLPLEPVPRMAAWSAVVHRCHAPTAMAVSGATSPRGLPGFGGPFTIRGMVAQNIIDSVFALPLAEQFELLDQLRERLRAEPSPLSEAHRRLLDERLDAFDADPTGGAPWDEVEAGIRAKLGRT